MAQPPPRAVMPPGRTLGDVVDLDEPEGWLDELVAAVADGDVDVGTLTDEELHLAHDRLEEEPPWAEDFPFVTELTPHQRRVAVETSVRLLVADGEAALDDDGVLRLRPVRVGAATELLAASTQWLSAVVETADQTVTELRSHRLADDLHLAERITELGFHHLTLRSRASQVAWLQGHLDPLGLAKATVDGPAATAASFAELDQARHTPASDSAARVTVAEPPPSHGDAEAEQVVRMAWLLADADGLTLAHPASADGQVPATARPLGPEGLAASVEQLLLPHRPDGPPLARPQEEGS